MFSRLPKILHPILGKPMIEFVVETALNIGSDQIVLVTSPDRPALRRDLNLHIAYAVQTVPRGTADAVQCGLKLARHPRILILSGDVPLLKPSTLKQLLDRHQAEQATLTFLTGRLANPTGYGRVIRNRRRQVIRIVEETDATPAQKNINEINAGIYLVQAGPLRTALSRIRADNQQGEFYLTDIVGFFLRQHQRVIGLPAADEQEIIGINTKQELARVREIVKQRWFAELMQRGVWIEDPATTTIDLAVEIGDQVRIRPCTVLEGRTRIPAGRTVGPLVWIRNNRICRSWLSKDR